MSRELFYKIRAILLRDWDPLNVGDNPHLEDEYDAYIPELLREATNKDENSIKEKLIDIENRVGVGVAPEQRNIAIMKLIQLLSG